MAKSIMAKSLDMNNVSKIINLPIANATGNAVEYDQFTNELANYFLANKVVTDINAVDGNVADAATVKAAITAAKSEILGGAGTDYDTLKEIEDWVSAHGDLYDALVSTVNGKLDTSKVVTDVTAAVTGEVIDGAALYTYLQSMIADHVMEKQFENVDLVADTNYELVHNYNCDARRFTVTASIMDGNDINYIDLQVVRHSTDPMNKIYVKANANFTGVFIDLKK